MVNFVIVAKDTRLNLTGKDRSKVNAGKTLLQEINENLALCTRIFQNFLEFITA